MIDIILELTLDILKTIPFLFLVYLLIELLNLKIYRSPSLLTKSGAVGPLVGAALGAIPQCGFSSAASALYSMGYIAPYTLIAIFLSTSDEAIPIMISTGNTDIIKLVMIKTIIGILGGYILKFTVFRKNKVTNITKIQTKKCECSANPLSSTLIHTIQTSIILFVSMFFIQLFIFFVGEQKMSSLFLNGSIFQPALCALIGLIPGCPVSVFLTELFIEGNISFGSVIAGLSTGAGFGYIILFKDNKNRKNSILILLLTYLIATIFGTIIQLF